MLHAVGQEGLLELAAPGLVQRQEQLPRRLLGDGAGALGAIAGDHVHQHRAQHALVVDAMVLEEPVILGREEGMFDQVGDLLPGHRNAALFADLRDQVAVAGIHAQRYLHFDVAHRINRGQRGFQVDITTGQAHGAEKCEQDHTARGRYQEGEVVSFHRT